MIHLQQTFTIHPVGQGLFYSGTVEINHHRSPSSEFKFVFDCGSLNTTNATEEVEFYKQGHFHDANTRLDLLVISHFDADHVSHIQQLLAGGRKVDKIILPFSTLEERLFLVLKYFKDKGRGAINNDNFPIRFMIDPIGSLGDNLDGGSTVYIVNSDPDPIPFAPSSNTKTIAEPEVLNNERGEFTFDIEDTKELTEDEISSFAINNIKGNIRTFNDSTKAFLRFGHRLEIMEFLFYRREVGIDDKSFFEEVFKTFCKQCKIPYSKKAEVSVDRLIEEVIKVKGAAKIREIFKKVKEKFPKVFVKGRDIKNMNTSALCMLHHNLPALNSLIEDDNWHAYGDIIRTQKLGGTNSAKVSECLEYPIYRDHYTKYEKPFVRFPNCLLTSDSFLQTEEEAIAFYEKYQGYWNRFWLFQVPHHGSTHNANMHLLSRLPHYLSKFINYGTTHRFIKRWQHPSPQLINDLIAAGQSLNVIAVNEFSGLQYETYYRFERSLFRE